MALKKHCFKMTGTGLYKLDKAKNGVKPAFSHYQSHTNYMTHDPSEGKYSDRKHAHKPGAAGEKEKPLKKKDTKIVFKHSGAEYDAETRKESPSGRGLTQKTIKDHDKGHKTLWDKNHKPYKK